MKLQKGKGEREMGSVFAVQVTTGLEIKAKEMLELVIQKANETLIKGIYALETHTNIISKKTQGSEVEKGITQKELSDHLERQELRARITNKRRQLDSIERYNTDKYIQLKQEYRTRINELEARFNEIGKSSKKIHSVMSGYILIELTQNSTYLPNQLWHLINSVPIVNKILSVNPIPEEELEWFATCLEEALEPQVEVMLNTELEYEEEVEQESDILRQINNKETKKCEEVHLLDKLNEVKLSVVEKVRKLVEERKCNPFLDRVKCFVRRNTEIIIMPLHYLEKLYTEEELQFIGERISAKDFLKRLKRMSVNMEVARC